MKIFFLLFSLVFVFNIEAVALDNKLRNHASPYLAMHGSDPVAWQEWNKETIKKAKKEGKLIYVSSGYFSCHWCHVMQRETYKNNHVAKILNANFIPVKVDREINSALDSRLIDFVERTQGRAGWPLNVFITPDGYPLVGMTYVPTKNFILVLNNLNMKWKEEKSLLEGIAIKATNELLSNEKEGSDNIQAGLGQEYVKRFLVEVKTRSDDMSGGFGQQNKFPLFPQLKAMLTAYEHNPEKESKQFLLLTLNKMSSQGLNDQLGGGFFRYAVDPAWQIPHFEKMLYDNALLASLYTDAARIFKNKKFEQVAKNTLDFMYKVLRSEQGAYIASLSAVDNKGVEGGYYLWNRDELKKILSEDEMKVVELIWQLEGVADIEGGHHLVEVMDIKDAAKMLKMSLVKAKKYFNSAKKKMMNLREKRNIPRDDKLLASWNGLVFSAYSKAAKQFNSAHYAKAAKDIKKYIYNNLWIEKKLVKAVKAKKIIGEGELEDYVYVAQALYDWLEYSDNKQDQIWLKDLIAQAWNRFHTRQGWILAENSLLKYGQGEHIIPDGVLPSASATLINLSLKVAEKNNDIKLKKKALRALNVGHMDVVSQPFLYASQVLALFEAQKSH